DFVAHLLVFVFFFSSRRRHTRFSRDWSSDVCSSDLPGTQPSCSGIKPQIFRKAQQHNVSKTEECHTKSVQQSSVYPGLFTFQVIQAQVGFITNGGKQLHHFS